MRSFGLLLLLLGSSACGSSSGQDLGAPDLAVFLPDLGVKQDLAPPRDLAASVDLAPSADLYPSADMGGYVVQVANGSLSFNPAMLTIARGSVVTWVWYEALDHNVISGTVSMNVGTPDNKFCSDSDTNCGSAPVFSSPHSYSHTFTTAGTFPYYCDPHAGIMRGTIVVVP